jgi:hypothetical protein
MSHVFEILTLAMMMLCASITIWIFVHSKDYQRAGVGSKGLVFVLFVIILCMLPTTFRKVFGRWKKVNAVAKVSTV